MINFFSLYTQKGTYDDSLHRQHPAQPPDTASPRQVIKNGLCLVVLVMRQCNLISLPRFQHMIIGHMAHLSSRLFFTPPFFPGNLRDLIVKGIIRNLVFCTVIFHQFFIQRRLLSPDPVVDMDRAELKIAAVLQLLQQKKQGHRVPASRDAGHNPVILSHHMILLHILPDFLLHFLSYFFHIPATRTVISSRAL